MPINTKLGRLVTNLELLLPIMLLYPLVTWLWEITWQSKNISTATEPKGTKIDGLVTNLKWLVPIIYSTPWSHGLGISLDKQKELYLCYHKALATKLGRRVNNFEQLLPIMFLYPLVTWSCDITWYTKGIISPLTQCLWPPNLALWLLTLRDFFP